MPESKYHLRVNVGFRIDAALDRLLAWRRRPGDPGIGQRRAGCPSLAVSWGIQDPEKPTTDHISARVPRPLHEAHPCAISRLSKRRSLPSKLRIAMLEPIPSDKSAKSQTA